MDLYKTSRTVIENKLESILWSVAENDSYLLADYTYCMCAKDRESWAKRMVANDIVDRINNHVPGTFIELVLSNTPDEQDLKFEEGELEKRSDYRPSGRFTKIFKSLARKAGVGVDEGVVSLFATTYSSVLDQQVNMDGSLLNVHYVIYKLTTMLSNDEDAQKIKAQIRLPKPSKLIQYDKRWRTICSNIMWISYKCTNTTTVDIDAIRAERLFLAAREPVNI